MNYSDFFQAVYDEYGIRQGSEEARRIMDKIAANKGSYKDIYDYALNRGEELAAILRETIVNHDYNMHREEAVEEARQFAEILLSYQDDVNAAAAELQEKINEDLGIHIKPQVSDPARDRAKGLAGKIFSEDEIKISNAENEISNFGMAAVDETIRRNADFQAKSGFETVVVREYDGIGLRRGTKYQEDCEWCRERAGVYNYRDVARRGSEVWRRHVGCGCTIDFVRNGKTERVSNYVIEKGQQKAGTARNIRKIEREKVVKSVPRDIIKLEDIIIHKSVGAKALNYDIIDKNTGEIFSFVEGTRIQNAEVFAGYKTKKGLNEDVVAGLTKEFGGEPEKWQHAKGIGTVDRNGEEIKAEVHWFQEESVGKVKFKVKKWIYDEG